MKSVFSAVMYFGFTIFGILSSLYWSQKDLTSFFHLLDINDWSVLRGAKVITHDNTVKQLLFDRVEDINTCYQTCETVLSSCETFRYIPFFITTYMKYIQIWYDNHAKRSYSSNIYLLVSDKFKTTSPMLTSFAIPSYCLCRWS